MLQGPQNKQKNRVCVYIYIHTELTFILSPSSARKICGISVIDWSTRKYLRDVLFPTGKEANPRRCIAPEGSMGSALRRMIVSWESIHSPFLYSQFEPAYLTYVCEYTSRFSFSASPPPLPPFFSPTPLAPYLMILSMRSFPAQKFEMGRYLAVRSTALWILGF